MILDPVSALHAAVSAVAPIVGVSIADPHDKSKWCICYQPAATPEQIAAAEAVLAAFTPE